MELRDVDQFVREGKFAQALQAIDMVRSSDPHNPYTAAYEVRVRGLLEEAARRNAHEPHITPSQALPSVEFQMNTIASPVAATHAREIVLTNAAGEMERIAVLSRIADLLGSATGHLSRGEYDQALDALDQAQVLDPENKEIAVFEDRVRAARQDALTVLGPTESAHGSPASEIPGMLAAARQAAARGDFGEAFRSVTTAAILEPGDAAVEQCEAEIRALQEDQQRQSEERREAEQRRNRKEAERAARAEIADADQERRHTAAIIARHVERARSLLDAGEYGHALVEIDHAFLLNPLDAQVRRLQQEINSAQSRSVRATKDPDRTRVSMIAACLAEAQRLRTLGKPEKALQAIGRLLVLDPTNDEALTVERTLQAEIAVAAPLRQAPPADTDATGRSVQGAVQDERDDGPRRKRRKTYLVAASLLATAVVTLFTLTQVLSWADGHVASPHQSLSAITPDATPAAEAPAAPPPADTAHAMAPVEQVPQVRRDKPLPTTIDTSRAVESSVEVIPGVLRLEEPVLPQIALGSDATERVTVKVLVDSTGRALLAAIVMSSNRAFNQPVVNAAMRSTYKPWKGQTVSKWVTIPFIFTN